MGQGGFQTRPYKDNNPMYMIGHYHKFIQFNVRVMAGQIKPKMFDNFLEPFIIKNNCPVSGANGDKIRSLLRIIVILQPFGKLRVFDRMERRRCFSVLNFIPVPGRD